MPINQPNKDKPVFCISCGKMICKGHIESGSIEIPCKCGVKNRIEANKPEGRGKLEFINVDTTKSASRMRM